MATTTSRNSIPTFNTSGDQISQQSAEVLSGTSEHLVPSLIAAQACIRPQGLAVQARDGELTYAALDQHANRLAGHLQSLGLGPEVIAGVYFTRSTSLVVNALAVLKAGGAYLPLDPGLPPDRLAFMLEDSGAAMVLTEKNLSNRLPGGTWHTVIDGQWLETTNEWATAPPSAVTSKNLAYLIYTSGSTGRPKGVEVTHSNLSHLISWHNRAFAVTPADRASQLANLGFDAAVWEMWPYLTAGATLCLSDAESVKGPEAVRDWLVANQITISFVPTPLAEEMLRLDWPAATRLRLLLTGGDTLHRYPRPDLPFAVSNNYGPTECTVVATSGLVPPRQKTLDLPPIGAPVQHAQIYILDAELRQVPTGKPGELYIGGAGVARGYRKRPELTADRFIPNPFQPGTRLYRTGDLGRYFPDGQVAFLGRVDDQVKIRGYRIEPDEIAAVLNTHPDINASSVIVREDVPGDKRLVAYVVGDVAHLTRSTVQAFLGMQLPNYMVPAVFVALDALPYTSNGKIDRAALPHPSEDNMLRDEIFAPAHSPVEQRLCAIVCTLLDISQVGLEDNFFLLGGHSLLGTQLIARIREAFDIDLPLRSLFDRPTIRELAAAIEELLFAKVQNMTEEEARRALGAEQAA